MSTVHGRPLVLSFVGMPKSGMLASGSEVASGPALVAASWPPFDVEPASFEDGGTVFVVGAGAP
jgi:hypothetical protein